MPGYTSVGLTNTRSDVFNTLSTLINANRPDGWTVLAGFPDNRPVFPCIVINSASVVPEVRTMLRSKTRRTIVVTIQFFAELKDRKKKIDEGMDNVMATILNNYSTLHTYHLVLDEPAAFEDSTGEQMFNEQVLNTGEIKVRFKLA